jgi:hypothetical protein
MRGMLVAIASLALLGMVGCGVDDDLSLGSEASAITLTSSTPVMQTAAVLPVALAYDSLPRGFQFVPRGCHFVAFITYSAGPGQYLTTGVCNRPRSVLWRVYGSNRGDFSEMNRVIQAQVARVTAEIEDESAASGAVFDFGTGGAGDFTKIGPPGGGPVGPGPGGPGGGVGHVLAYLFDEARAVEALVTTPAIPGVNLPGGAYEAAP